MDTIREPSYDFLVSLMCQSSSIAFFNLPFPISIIFRSYQDCFIESGKVLILFIP